VKETKTRAGGGGGGGGGEGEKGKHASMNKEDVWWYRKQE